MSKKETTVAVKKKDKGGRPKIEVDLKGELPKLCSLQCTLEEVASWYQVSEDTVERRVKEVFGITFKEAFKRFRGSGYVSLRRHQFELAKRFPAMAIWLGKQLLGQKERLHIDKGEGWSRDKLDERGARMLEGYLHRHVQKNQSANRADSEDA